MGDNTYGVFIAGFCFRVYVIEGWDERMAGDKTMVIRPLTVKEMAIWLSNWEEFGFETYAHIMTQASNRRLFHNEKGESRGEPWARNGAELELNP